MMSLHFYKDLQDRQAVIDRDGSVGFRLNGKYVHVIVTGLVDCWPQNMDRFVDVSVFTLVEDIRNLLPSKLVYHSYEIEKIPNDLADFLGIIE